MSALNGGDYIKRDLWSVVGHGYTRAEAAPRPTRADHVSEMLQKKSDRSRTDSWVPTQTLWKQLISLWVALSWPVDRQPLPADLNARSSTTAWLRGNTGYIIRMGMYMSAVAFGLGTILYLAVTLVPRLPWPSSS